ncbi:MAG: hypothetical protein RMJ81_01565 [Candidatus Kryptonium sp.]|nr:hypothetical protein [Candidatus Kryptonium sp.]MCX7762072.1 hypothetical protein [Candidatus Kryptonium sp.]MDW8108324.1 hypothetical protein [Candidatus Kryptonium sp.]
MILKVLILTLLFFSISASDENQIYKVKKLYGEARVRHGLKEQWDKLSLGDTLRPGDTILLDKNGYVEIDGNNKTYFKSSGGIIINIIDLRRLTKEELLLQLAFEEIKSVPNTQKEKQNARSTGVYGTGMEKGGIKLKSGWNLIDFWVSGVRALFENGFYETAAIRAKNLMSKFDELKDNIELRIIVASSLEKLQLYGEAISELNKILLASKDETLNYKIERKINDLKLKIAPPKEKK